MTEWTSECVEFLMLAMLRRRLAGDEFVDELPWWMLTLYVLILWSQPPLTTCWCSTLATLWYPAVLKNLSTSNLQNSTSSRLFNVILYSICTSRITNPDYSETRKIVYFTSLGCIVVLCYCAVRPLILQNTNSPLNWIAKKSLVALQCEVQQQPLIRDSPTLYCTTVGRAFAPFWLHSCTLLLCSAPTIILQMYSSYTMRSAATATNSRSCNIAQNSPLACANPLCTCSQCHPNLVQPLSFSDASTIQTSTSFSLSPPVLHWKYLWSHVQLQSLVYSLMFVAQKLRQGLRSTIHFYFTASSKFWRLVGCLKSR